MGTPAPVKVALYRRLALERALDLTVVYASSESMRTFDGGFGAGMRWDADLTTGYRSRFLAHANVSPGLGDHVWSVRDTTVVREILRGRFDVVVLGGYHSVTYLLGAATQLASGRAVLFREEQTLLEPRSLVKTLIKAVVLRALFSQGSALCIGTENRRWFEHYGVPQEKLFLAPYAVDNDGLQAAAQLHATDRPELRRSFGIDDDGGPVILSVSRLIPKKQPLFLLEAFRRARERARCTLLIAGSGELETQMREIVASRSIPDVKFCGFVNRSRIGHVYGVADVFALLSRAHETFGLVVPEAMNFGLPVVVSERVGCAADLVANGVNGFVVSHTDPEPAALALGELVADAGLREAMGRASLRRVGSWSLTDEVDGFLRGIAAVVGPARWARAQGKPAGPV
ncbi:MAG TPA: glycosyltransferase family 4 protein [Solirubrobacteraceae bacterium]|nr:glycosyltransferase family 4 protein [Solirubrobacteraceae bacterium]